MNALDYLLKANLYAGLFAGCYWLLLRRHTFFGVNRAYLLASVVLSLTLPLVSLPAQTLDSLPATLTAPVGVIALPAVTVSATGPDSLAKSTADTLPVATEVDWSMLAGWLYGAVVMLLLTRLVWHVAKLLRAINASAQEQREGYVLVQPDNVDTPTFSFFRYLVVNPADRNNALILRHELVHIQQYHSADVLTLTLLRAVFWACPALWLLDRAVRETHEFLADRVAIRHVPEQPARPGAEQYARFLVEYAFGVRPDGLANGFFNPSLLKRRIQMMQQGATNRWALGKYALVLPLAFALLAMTTAREDISAALNNTITVTGRVTSAADGKPLPGVSVVDANTSKGTTTDTQGNYKLVEVSPGHTLAFSFVGFALKKVTAADKPTINVKLTAEDADELPAMGATKMYKSIKPNPKMPARAIPTSETINGKVWTAVEEPPVFKTGIPGLMQHVAQNLRYPAKAKAAGITGDVLVQFSVLPSGVVSNVAVSLTSKKLGYGCEEEAMRVVRSIPRWIPGQQHGKPVGGQFNIPIRFALDKEDKRTGRYEPTFKPLNSPIGDYTMVKPATHFTEQSMNRYSMPVRSHQYISIPSDKFDTIPKVRSLYRKPFLLDRRKTTIGNSLPIDMQEKADLILIEGKKQIDRDKLNAIDPDDIESIHVDKSEETITKYRSEYGEKADKGVVIIRLKSSKVL